MFCKNPHCVGTKEFELTAQERRLLDDFGVPGENMHYCRQCREMRRLAWRNERTLFKRICDQTGKPIWSVYPANTPFKVFDKDVWWGDTWEGTTFGREVDFNRPFFQQFYELMLQVPRSSLVQAKNQNSNFTNDANNNNDCYLIFTSDDNVNCHYGSFINCKDSLDCEELIQCELCYDCLYCNRCHSTIGSQYCMGCSNVYFSSNLVNCHNCFFCFGLRDQRNCIFNTEVSPDVFINFVMQRQLFRRKSYAKARQMYDLYLETVPQRYMYLLKTENSTGDRLLNCKDCENCYSVENGVACSNLSITCLDVRDCMDCYGVSYGTQRSFENQTCLWGGFNFVANFSNNCSNCFYIDSCQTCQNCFGCIGLKNKKNCIFNKQYSSEEYEVLKNKLIAHLKTTGEWGQFFPFWTAPFPFNITLANFYFPLTREQYGAMLLASQEQWPPPSAYSLDYLWHQEEKKEEATHEKVSPPDSLFEAKNEDVLNATYVDVETQKPFRVMGRELALYQQMKLPLPELSFDSRYRVRLRKYNPRRLYKRNCHRCKKSFETTFIPDSPYIIFCEDCFQSSLL